MYVSFLFFPPFLFHVDVTWRGQEAKLILHYNDGFSLIAPQMSGPEAGQERLLWKFPFEKLKMSADDSQRLLWLDFGGDDGEQVSTTCALYHSREGNICLRKWLLFASTVNVGTMTVHLKSEF